MSQLFNDLPYGKAYLFKGNTNKLFYLLQDSPNVRIFTGINLKDLSATISFDLVDYVYYYQHQHTIPETLVLPPLVRLFILFSFHDDTDTATTAKFKHYESRYYTTLNYSKFSVKKDCPELYKKITSAKHDPRHNLNKLDWERFYPYPLTTEQLLANPCRHAGDLITDSHEISQYIKALATTKRFDFVSKLSSLNKSILDAYFTPPFRSFIDIMNKDKELPWSLFYWYKLYYQSNKSITSLSSNDHVFLFFLWVHRSSTILNRSFNQGLFKYLIKGKTSTYLFRPSHLAVDEFYEDLTE